jgi:cell wall-associated NlpC family hydrolase
VEPSVEYLQPGDILGFSDGGGGVTHVGLYAGEGMFIHSSSSGVKLSSLIDPDGDGRWWQQRWVTARRLIN